MAEYAANDADGTKLSTSLRAFVLLFAAVAASWSKDASRFANVGRTTSLRIARKF